jgi:hypothetical protein
MNQADAGIPFAYASPLAPAVPVPFPQQHVPDHPAAAAAATMSRECMNELLEQGFTRGLVEALWNNKRSMPMAYWVVDNSGSMATPDGHRLIRERNGSCRVAPCSRWRELVDSVEYQAQLAAILQKTTVFRLLNEPGIQAGPRQFSVNERGEAFLDEDVAIACSTLQNVSPRGVTPLVKHLQEIRDEIRALEGSLRQSGTQVAVVLATDGIPTDDQGNPSEAVRRSFVQTLKSLEGLPVWMVVKLCTDEESVVQFWNEIDREVELSIEVLDDYPSEALEVHKLNPWLNYGLPLHRVREIGFFDRTFDLIDERKLYKEELVPFFRVLFGAGALDGIADPEVDWDAFVRRIENLTQAEKTQWNPVTKRREPWINIQRLKREYGRGWNLW